ncbi:MAG: protoporphyrinogen oxidase [Planctomycetes bacterium]|nr:protoporphyrinogen oxidase [Planctomycetota bacterium]
MVKRIAVVGAGISGLSVAFRLQEKLPDADITIVEQASRPGGTAWTLREAGFQVEIGPNGFLDTKESTLQLSRQVGLEKELIQGSEARKNRYLFLGDHLRALPSGFCSFLWTGLLSFRGKFSLLWERFRAQRTETGDESIDAFARRRAGDEAADVFADALVTGIYAGDPKLLSLPACFPKLADMEREYGSVIKGFFAEARKRKEEAEAKGEVYERSDRIWSFSGGMRTLVEALMARLTRPPQFGVAIRGLSKSGGPSRPVWRVHTDGNDGWDADAVVLTCPAHQQATILAELDGELAQSVGAIVYNRVVVVALGFRKSDLPAPLDGFGYIAPQNTRRDVLGVQWCSSVYQGRAPDDCVLVRAMAGGWNRPEIVDWDDDRLLTAVRAELRLAMGIESPPIFHKIIRWDRAIPQYQIGHLDRLSGIDARLATHPGLYLGGNAYRGVALNDCTEQGELLAARIGRFFAPLAA